MLKNLIYAILFMLPYMQNYATGMAIGINNLILQNNSLKTITFLTKNFDKPYKITLAKQQACFINKYIMFLPNLIDNSNNFYILFKVESEPQYSPIYIAKNNQLEILTKNNSSNNKFSLSAICSNNKVYLSPIDTLIINSNKTPPLLAPKYCKNNYNFIFSYKKSLSQSNNLTNLKPCIFN